MVSSKPEVVKEVPKDSYIVSTKESNEINWVHTILLTITPALAFIGLLTTSFNIYTAIWTFLLYLWTGLGITAGYHRLWAHRAYKAVYPVRLFLCLGGAAAFEGSAKWWCRNHRAHHRYTDTTKDPYNATIGFFYSHMGWMLVKQKARNIGFADISDLHKDSMIMWQHKYYPFVAIGSGVVFPTLVAGLVWGDWAGGFFFSSMLRIVIVHHATFFVNSLAHWWGQKSFSDHHTAFDSVITAVLTLGEGYHNYHHEFPNDYRNGIKVFQYDPTKWLIRFLNFFNLTWSLQKITPEEITKAQIQMAQREIDHEKAALAARTVITKAEFDARIAKGEELMVVDNFVYDVKSFVQEHPGGRNTLLSVVGKDATAVFQGQGAQHAHSEFAYKLLHGMLVAVLDDNKKSN